MHHWLLQNAMRSAFHKGSLKDKKEEKNMGKKKKQKRYTTCHHPLGRAIVSFHDRHIHHENLKADNQRAAIPQ